LACAGNWARNPPPCRSPSNKPLNRQTASQLAARQSTGGFFLPVPSGRRSPLLDAFACPQYGQP
jgi:hypothetical protein